MEPWISDIDTKEFEKDMIIADLRFAVKRLESLILKDSIDVMTEWDRTELQESKELLNKLAKLFV